MPSSTHSIVLIVLFILSSLVIADDNFGSPQQTTISKQLDEGEFQHPLVIEYNNIFATLLQSENDAEKLRDKIAVSTGNDKLSLQTRHFDYAVSTLKQLDLLTKNIQAQREAGLDISDTISNIRVRMLSYGPKIRQAISKHEREFLALQPSLEKDTTAYLLAFSTHLNYVDTALKYLFRHVENLATLGLNNEDSTRYMHAELQRRAELLTGKLQLLSDTRDTLQTKISHNEKDQSEIDNLNFTNEKIELIADSLKITTQLMENAGLDSSTYQSLMISSTGNINTDILNIKVLKKLLNQKLEKLSSLIRTQGVELLFRIFLFIGIMFCFWFISLFSGFILKFFFSKKSNSSYLMRAMLTAIIRRGILLVGFLFALSQFGVSLLPLLTGLGIAGFVIGFALQDTLGNFASGMMILIYRPYDVGDTVSTGGVKGRVESMNLVSTTIMTIDNQTLILPNSKIWGDVITNLTDQTIRRIDMKFHLPLDSDVDDIFDFFHQILNRDARILSEPKATVELNGIDEHALEFIVRPWVKTADYWSTFWDLNAEVKRQLDLKNIKLPVKQHEITVHKESLL